MRSTIAGKTVLLNLWATWCVPCREEMPALNALQKEMGSEIRGRADQYRHRRRREAEDLPAEIGVDALQLYRDNTISSCSTA